MKTAQEMYQYCNQQHFFGGTDPSFSLKHFEVLAKNLRNDETVLVCFLGMHNRQSASRNDGFYAYALTNQRFIMGQKKMLGETFRVITRSNLQEFRLMKEHSLDYLMVLTSEDTIPIVLTEGESQAILIALTDAFENPSADEQPKDTSLTIAEQLIKMKELLDAGILSPAEFEKIKKDLLQ